MAAHYASLLPFDHSQMYVWSKFEDSFLCGHLGNEIKAIGEYFPMFNIREILPMLSVILK